MKKAINGSSSSAKKSKGRPSRNVSAAASPLHTETRNPLQDFISDVFTRKAKKESTAERRKRQATPTGLSIVSAPKATVRAALYVRVSSDRSVRSDLSMPDQESQLRRFCDQQGWEVVAVYYEPGKSAKSTARREFKNMITDASCEGDPPFDKILIHNTSRFSRSTRDYMVFEALLHQKNVEILSITQSFSKDAGGMVAMRLTNLMDEFYSLRSSVDSTRARRRMVDKGFWPGGVPPYGYECVASPENSQRSILQINQQESVLVEKVYSLAVYGDGTSGPLGVKGIVRLINAQGYRTRNGSTWAAQGLHRILTNSAYYGDYFWGVSQVEHQFQERQEALRLKVPEIISRADFDKVQEMFEERNPRKGGAKLVGSPLLLSGIARCACGASMTLGTGTGKLGKVYRYYRCSSDNRGTNLIAPNAAHKNICPRPRVREDMLDAVVLEQVKDQVLSSERLLELLTKLRERQTLARERESGLVPELRARINKAEVALTGLFAIAKQIPSVADQIPYQNDVTAVSIELRAANQMLSDMLRKSSNYASEITPESVDLFRHDILEVLFGENRKVAKVYLRSIVAAVIVGKNHIDIQGFISDLEDGVDQARLSQLNPSVSGVRTYERRWRRGWDSNPRYAFDVYSLSRGAPSTTRPPLR